MGHNTHRYRLFNEWGTLDKNIYPVKDCHEMVIDRSGRIFLLTNETKNNVLIYDRSGSNKGSWGLDCPGAHGLTIHDENGEEFLFICDYDRHQILKTTLGGKIVFILDYPKEAGVYPHAEKYRPTETAIAPNGDIYVTDGYGMQFVIQYNHKGEYVRHWGGLGPAEDKFDCVHGIAVDRRDPGNPTLLITSRNHNAWKRFTLDGKYLSTIHLPGSFVCRPVIYNQNIYGAVFRSVTNTNHGSGYVVVLDKDDKMISSPGAICPFYLNGILQPQHQAEQVFLHPHDVCVDADENLYIPQWNAGNVYPFLLERIS